MFSYWTGPQPAWIGLCLDTIRRNSPTTVVLDDHYWTSGDYTGDISPELILRQTPNVRSDILRSWLLLTNGGIWVDADAIVWRDLRPIARWLDRRQFVCYRAARRGGLCSALIASRPGSTIATAYWGAIRTRLATGRRLATLAIGPALLQRTIRRCGRARVHFLRPELVHPIHWSRRSELLTDATYEPQPAAWTFMLTHRSLGRLRSASRAEILDSPTLIGRLFRRALGV